MNTGTLSKLIPVYVSLKDLAIVIAGLAKDVDDVKK